MESEIEQLRKRVEALEKVQNREAYSTLVNLLIQTATDVTDADVSVTVSDSVGEDGGTVSFNILDFPDKWLRVLYNGRVYRVGGYLESEDATR
jgi:hypothetical protein